MATRISELTFSGSLTPDTLFLVEIIDSGTLTTHKASGQQVLDFVGTNSGTSSGGGGGSGFDSMTYGVALDALHTAWAGTNAADAAWSYAGQAWTIATAGTTAAHEADSWARDAFAIATAGTDAAHAAWDYAGQAWTIATAGTNAAHEADEWARDAFGMAVAGTDAASAVDTTARIALNTAWDGTTAAHSADSWARDAYSLAVSGTDAIAVVLAQASAIYSLALQALNAAWAGTTATLPFYSQDFFQNYNTSPILPLSSPLTNLQIASGTNFNGPAFFNGTSAPDAQVGFSGTSSGWPIDSFEQYQTGTVFTALTISAGTGWTGPGYVY